jgi:hypothetical protein
LGVQNITKFGRALRLRWLWHARKMPNRPWVGTLLPCDEVDRSLFAAATEITLGDGSIAKFWSDHWLSGTTPAEVAPSLYAISMRKNRTMQQALSNDKWLVDLSRGLIHDMLPELLNLARLLDEVIFGRIGSIVFAGVSKARANILRAQPTSSSLREQFLQTSASLSGNAGPLANANSLCGLLPLAVS